MLYVTHCIGEKSADFLLSLMIYHLMDSCQSWKWCWI